MTRTTIFLSMAANFWPHTCVTAASIFAHASHVDLHIFSDGASGKWLSRLQARAEACDSKVFFHPFDSSLVADLTNCGHYGLATYYRLFIPDLLAETADKLIYLDSDMIVRSSMHDLYDVDLGDAAVAAVPVFSRSANAEHAQRLGHGVDCPYFNAGLMLIDVRRWRDQAIKDRCLAFHAQSPERVRYADQDMLNFCLAGDYKQLPLRWNVMVEAYGDVDPSDLDQASLDELMQARTDPSVVHFNGQFKPWHYTYRHPRKHDYLSVRRSLQTTPYLADDFPWGLPAKLLRRVRRGLSQ